MRQVVLDTETTGLDWKHGHRVIEIGCVEIIDRRRTSNNFHCYLNPDRDIDAGAQEVHGLSRESLADKPRFAEISAGFIDYVGDAELVIHNASFDMGFLDNEFKLAALDVPLSRSNSVLDTLLLARQLNPGQRNSLDALCKRFGIDNSRRDLHGALLDAQLLADVYLVMTGGQAALSLSADEAEAATLGERGVRRIAREGLDLVELQLSETDQAKHEAYLDMIGTKAGSGGVVWRR